MDLRAYILALNRKRSDEFCAPGARDALRLYGRRHPTAILVFKCMDGRLNLSLMTNTPTGILQPFRNIGGKFRLGSPYLGRLVLDAKERALTAGQRTLALCTYHFSRSSRHRGCAGHHYDADAARAGAVALAEEFEHSFGRERQVVAAVVVGIETDEDALIFHGHDTRGAGTGWFSIADVVDAPDEEIEGLLFATCEGMNREILIDLLPLALGNRDHVRSIRRQNRPVADIEHGENIIAVGRGFDWMHLPNKALIIGPYDHAWGDAVRVAGGIVQANLAAGHAPGEDGALLMVSAPYWSLEERGLAIAKARFLAEVAMDALAGIPIPLQCLVGVTAMETRLFQPLEG